MSKKKIPALLAISFKGEKRNLFHWLKTEVSLGLFFFPFPAPRVSAFLSCNPFLCLQSQKSSLFRCFWPWLSSLFLTCKGPSDYSGPNRLVRTNPCISKVLNNNSNIFCKPTHHNTGKALNGALKLERGSSIILPTGKEMPMCQKITD